MSTTTTTSAPATSTTKSRKNVLRKTSLTNHETKIVGLYDLEHTIGQGHFAVVKLARHVFTGEKVAVKIIDKTKLDPLSTAHMMQEVRCMKLVRHPNIVRLYEVIDTQTKLFLILELGDYDMYEFIMKRTAEKGVKEVEAQKYFSQIIKAIDYCHTLHVVHRDLKLENVVFFESLGMVKLTDFGFSNLFTPGQQLETSCGSLAYSAPEILLGDAYDAPAVDVWSLGVLLYMLVIGRLPFQETNDSETLTKILDCKYSIPDYVSPSCKQLISRMLVRDPEKRATLSEIVQSPWVTAGDRGLAEALPLIVRDHLPDSAHTTIIEQMVAGGIGTEDDILGAIEEDEYNYMTATYYLLAERVLSSYREEQAQRLLCNGSNDIDDAIVSEAPMNGTAAAATSSSAPVRSRSRSNSWRGPVSRRACTILKEESEEELSTYLRSSSRQSSRFYKTREHSQSSRASLAPSRTNSTDSFIGSFAIREDEVEHDGEDDELLEQENGEAIQQRHLHSIPNRVLSLLFDELSPIRELESSPLPGNANGPDARTPEREAASPAKLDKRRSLSVDSSARATRKAPRLESPLYQRLLEHSMEPVDESEVLEPESPPMRMRSWTWNPRGGKRRRFTRNAESLDGCGDRNGAMGQMTEARLTRTPSEPLSSRDAYLKLLAAKLQRRRRLLQRRNSSPSVSMFHAGLTASRDRISPQAIHDLIDFTRLSSGMRRAASPDSRYSSRSPSPPNSSGRTSPAISGIVSRLKASSIVASSGGMRKLSSSPHLLGICEESEDGTDVTMPVFKGTGMVKQRSTSSAASTSNMRMNVRSTRSASTGIAAARLQKSSDSSFDGLLPPQTSRAPSNPNLAATYSASRIVRPRQAVVSPDMLRRYDTQRFLHKTRRSTSCSSSETSEDEDRRLNLIIGSKYCKRDSDQDPKPDDDPPRGPNGDSERTVDGKPLLMSNNNTAKNSTSQAAPNGSADAGNARKTNAYDPSLLDFAETGSIFSRVSSNLHPIMEHPACSADDYDRTSLAKCQMFNRQVGNRA